MKIRLLLSGIAAISYLLISQLYKVFESPLVGAANAQQMNDTMTGYGIHSAMSLNAPSNIAFYIFLLVMLIIWLPPYFRKSNKQNNEN